MIVIRHVVVFLLSLIFSFFLTALGFGLALGLDYELSTFGEVLRDFIFFVLAMGLFVYLEKDLVIPRNKK